jgi:hypothetical protein
MPQDHKIKQEYRIDLSVACLNQWRCNQLRESKKLRGSKKVKRKQEIYIYEVSQIIFYILCSEKVPNLISWSLFSMTLLLILYTIPK